MELRSKRRKNGEVVNNKRTVKSRKKKKTIYCGNNSNAFNEEENVMGTPYECLRKGFMFGAHRMPLDMKYAEAYEQLMPRKIWCGKEKKTARELRMGGYDFNGILSECFRYGLGSGRRYKAMNAVRR
jgi:hypothetical protein